MLAKQVFRVLILAIVGLHVGLLLVDGLPVVNILVGICAHLCFLAVLATFPFFHITSGPFVGSCVLLGLDHLLWFRYFGTNYHPFAEVVGFFGLCVWLVPFLFFISLSANESTLPTAAARAHAESGRGVSSSFKGLLDWLARRKPTPKSAGMLFSEADKFM